MTWLQARRVPLMLALAMLVPIAALSWLGARTLQQDRQLEKQRQRDRLEVAAGRVALDIERRLQTTEEQLRAGGGIRFTSGGIESAESAILFQPIEPQLASVSDLLLASAEAAEFRERDFRKAAASYEQAAASRNEQLRAAALLGLGRVLQRQGLKENARSAYDELVRQETVIVAGQPAGLVGGRGAATRRGIRQHRAALPRCRRPGVSGRSRRLED